MTITFSAFFFLAFGNLHAEVSEKERYSRVHFSYVDVLELLSPMYNYAINGFLYEKRLFLDLI